MIMYIFNGRLCFALFSFGLAAVNMAPAEDGSRHLPIDISYAKLAEWLVDRRKIPSDWRKKILQIRSRIASALLVLPKDADPWFLTLNPDSVGYLEAKKISEILIRTTPEERTVFGRLSGVAGEWNAIVRAYEKDLIYLGEAAQIMIQNVNYEIPFQKKQTAKVQQQLADLERKEAEFKRNATNSASKYLQACQELGIAGKNVRTELLAGVNSLPKIFADVGDVLCRKTVGEALELYQAFVSCAHTEPEDEPTTVLQTLREVRSNPSGVADDFTCFLTQESHEENVESGNKDRELTNDEVTETSPAEPNPGMNAEEESSGIQWDIDLGDSPGIELESPEPKQDSLNEETEISEIVWDIDVEDGGGIDGEPRDQSEYASSDIEQTLKDGIVSCSRLADMKYRNNFLNDLSELKAFLSQRIQELESTETSTLQNQMQAVAPAALQQYGVQALKEMGSEVSGALNLLTNSRTRDLLMILTSKRYLDRLEASLQQKKQIEVKLLDSLKDVEQKRVELRNALSSSWPKQEALISRTRQIKLNVEKTLSLQYDGRPVNIIGEINTVLGQA